MGQFRTFGWLCIVGLISVIGLQFRMTTPKRNVRYKFHEDISQKLSFQNMYDIRRALENQTNPVRSVIWFGPPDYRITFRENETRIDMCDKKLPHPRSDDIISDQMQTVVQGKSYVFSAYFDGRIQKHNLVRIVAIINKAVDNATPTWCQMWYPNKEEPEIVRLYRQQIPDNRGEK